MFGPPQKPLLWTEKNRKALALLCLTSGLQPNAANPSESMIRELLSCDKDGCFSSKNVFVPSQKPWLWTAKTEGTSSAMFGVGTGAKCWELER